MLGIGKLLMALGAGLFVLGLCVVASGRFGWMRLGRLPGDLHVQRGGASLYFPIVTCVVLSFLASLILWGLSALRR